MSLDELFERRQSGHGPRRRFSRSVPGASPPGQTGSTLIFSRFLASRPQATPSR